MARRLKEWLTRFDQLFSEHETRCADFPSLIATKEKALYWPEKWQLRPYPRRIRLSMCRFKSGRCATYVEATHRT
jgi:hypothetical protein